MPQKFKKSADNLPSELTRHQKVGVFVDAQNMYHSARNLYSKKVNFAEILKSAVSGRRLIRAFAYVVRTKTGEEKPFFEAKAPGFRIPGSGF